MYPESGMYPEPRVITVEVPRSVVLEYGGAKEVNGNLVYSPRSIELPVGHLKLGEHDLGRYVVDTINGTYTEGRGTVYAATLRRIDD